MTRISATKGKRPGFFLWAKDWLTSEAVRTMPRTARSIYLDLLALQSLSDSLPSDPEVLARLVGEPLDLFLEAWVEHGLKDQFDLVDGRLQNPRLTAEFAADDAYKGVQSANGRRGGRPRGKANRNPTESQPVTQPVSQHQTQTLSEKKPPSPSPSPTLSQSAREAQPPTIGTESLAKFPALDTPTMRVAVAEWEAYRAEAGLPCWTLRTWALNLAKWEAWGAEVAFKAIRDSMQTGAKTPFIHRHPTDQPAPEIKHTPIAMPADFSVVHGDWMTMHGRRSGSVPKFPGYDKAKAELEAAKK